MLLSGFIKAGLGQGRGFIAPRSSTTPVQTLIDAWMAAGIGSIALPDPLYYSTPIDAPGVLTDAVPGYSVVYSAASAAGTPLLVNDGSGPNGRAYFSANGVSQTLKGNTAETVPACIALLHAHASVFPYSAILDNAEDSVAWSGIFQEGTTRFRTVEGEGTPQGVRKNGAVASGYDLAPINEWMIVTVHCSHASESHFRQLFTFWNGQAGYGNFDLAAVGKWLGPDDPTLEQIAAAEAAASTYSGIALV